MGTYNRLLTHIVFSTKFRKGSIHPDLKDRLLPYMAGIVRSLRCTPLALNCVPDHVHLLAQTPPALPLSEFMRTVKNRSSRWVHENYPESASFAWQGGYAAFSIGRGEVERVRKYIANQEAHHGIQSFHDELVEALQSEGISFDERYLQGD